jgi:hypothetical protein
VSDKQTDRETDRQTERLFKDNVKISHKILRNFCIFSFSEPSKILTDKIIFIIQSFSERKKEKEREKRQWTVL